MKHLQSSSGAGNYGLLISSRHAVSSLALAAVLFLAGCAATQEKPGAMVDPNADFDAYETFDLLMYTSPDGSDQPMSLVDNHIRTAIEKEMLQKGYSEAPAGTVADIMIDYEAARTETVKESPFRIGIGIGSYGRSGGASVGTSTSGVRKVTEGSLVIHAVDSARDAEVWRSRASRELGKGEIDAQDIESIVSDVLSDFPARSEAP